MLESLFRINRSVRRTHSSKYLLVMLVSFAVSVSLTRAFLNLTGFPQLGSGKLHIAHVLWGGLILYIATIIPLLYANRWVYPFSAVLSGIGIGLFIDEVGKFITSTNDYFFAPAATIIYSFFLISVLLYLRIRSKRVHNPRTALYRSFDMMEEILEHELDDSEKIELVHLLTDVRDESPDKDYQNLAIELLNFVQKEQTVTIQKKMYFTDRIRIFYLELSKKYLTPARLHLFTTVSLFILGAFNLVYPLRFFLAIPVAGHLSDVVMPYIQSNMITSHSSLDWLTARVALQAMVGLILLAASILLVTRHIRQGLLFAFLGMLLLITTLDLLIFYYDQFSTIAYVAIQVVIFLSVQQYRQQYRSDNRLN
jgi:hypothetical protein